MGQETQPKKLRVETLPALQVCCLSLRQMTDACSLWVRISSAILGVTHRKFTGQFGANGHPTGWSEDLGWVQQWGEKCPGAITLSPPSPSHLPLLVLSGVYQLLVFSDVEIQ